MSLCEGHASPYSLLHAHQCHAYPHPCLYCLCPTYIHSPAPAPVSSGRQGGFGAGVCPGTAPGALIARSLVRKLRCSMGGSMEGHPHGP
eukprot:3695106-Pleurochrysis_carterae.AAC.1